MLQIDKIINAIYDRHTYLIEMNSNIASRILSRTLWNV